MDYIISNLPVIIVILIIVIAGAITIYNYANLSEDKRYEKLQGWLLQAVITAEEIYGGGTGRLKLSYVYDLFCERFPWLAKIISFEKFSEYVDDSLEEMEYILKTNKNIANIVNGSITEGV